jgi:O-antigen/teichoic acid export membrane protein
MSRVGFISTAVAGLAAILAAYYGAGVWALVVQSLVASVLTTATLWLISDWRPRFRFSAHAARRLFRFGGFVFLSSVLEVIYARAYAVLIGKGQGVYELGIYGRANDLSRMPSVFMGGVVSRVLFSLFSMTDTETDAVRRRMKRAVTGIMFLHVPIMLGLVAVAHQFVPAVFGPQWLPSVPFLQVLCVAGIFWPLHAINLQALLGSGYSGLYFRIEVAKKVIGVTCLITGAFFGLMGIAMGQLVAGLIALVINAHYSESRLGYGLFEQLRDSAPALSAGLTMALSVFGLDIMLSPYFDEPSVFRLGLLVLAGAFLYIAVSWIFRLRALDEVIKFANLGGQSVRGL